MQTLVAWPPQKAWMPNQMQDMKTRSMTGTAKAKAALEFGVKVNGAGYGGELTIRTPHAPRGSAGHGKADMMVCSHPSASNSEKTGQNATQNLK